jgi:hypothetical protein
MVLEIFAGLPGIPLDPEFYPVNRLMRQDIVIDDIFMSTLKINSPGFSANNYENPGALQKNSISADWAQTWHYNAGRK